MNHVAAQSRYERMQYRPCGKSGLRLPAVSLGLWHNFGTRDDYANMCKMLTAAFDLGITHFDVANNYGPEPGSAEENLGKVLRSELHAYRDELIISTKAGYQMWPGPYGDWGSRKSLLASLDQSLKRMGLPYVDIFYHHRMDPDTPLEESMGALAQAVHSGRALYAGISNYDAATAARATRILDELHCPYVLDQVRYSIFDRRIESDDLLGAAGDLGLGLIIFSPLAQGMLSDRYLNGVSPDSRAGKNGPFLKAAQITSERLAQIRALGEIAAERGQTLAQMALSWVLRNPTVTSVLIGASNPEQIVQNAAVVSAPPFSAEELARIEAISR